MDSVRMLIDMSVLGSAQREGLASDTEIEVELRAHRDNVCAAARSYEQKLRDKLAARGAAAPAEVAPLPRSELLKSDEETGDPLDAVADRMFAARMFASLDENGDGVITREEFQKFCALDRPARFSQPLPLNAPSAAPAAATTSSESVRLRTVAPLRPVSASARFSARDAWLKQDATDVAALTRRVHDLLNSKLVALAEPAGLVRDATIVSILKECDFSASLAAARLERKLRTELQGEPANAPAASPAILPAVHAVSPNKHSRSPDKVAERMFSMMDADGDGVITRNELLRSLRASASAPVAAAAAQNPAAAKIAEQEEASAKKAAAAAKEQKEKAAAAAEEEAAANRAAKEEADAKQAAQETAVGARKLKEEEAAAAVALKAPGGEPAAKRAPAQRARMPSPGVAPVLFPVRAQDEEAQTHGAANNAELQAKTGHVDRPCAVGVRQKHKVRAVAKPTSEITTLQVAPVGELQPVVQQTEFTPTSDLASAVGFVVPIQLTTQRLLEP